MPRFVAMHVLESITRYTDDLFLVRDGLEIMRAWLVTWESWNSTKVKGNDKIAAILDSSLSPDCVREVVELLYANHEYLLSERLRYVSGKPNPYPATLGALKGVPGENEIICGHAPYLRARHVENCRVEGEGRLEKLTWDEISK